ncbi:hypothetical protein [Actinomadura rupiterrae]|uniref:hypothetical protein n=1 Tax=Actinomadura rupiterrae TaxID=559627 RepID=UPI0020A47561|nr:hypothetical protein [Actinomadura rupiterrae]MCP2339170.1 hypothetical protein [Actinomadura rupiterrae]
MAPSLVTSYAVYANASNTTTLTTTTFTPSNGEVLVVKLATWDTAVSMGAPTGGSQTFTSRNIVAPGGFNNWCGIYTAVVSGSPVNMTVSSTPSATSWHSMVVERWSGATLAASPAVNATTSGTGTCSTTLTTTAANSVVSWTSADASDKDPSTRAYLSSATEDGLQDGHVGNNMVAYYAYQSAATAGSQTMGLSAPTPQTWVLAGIEVKAAATASGPIKPLSQYTGFF